MAVHGQALFGGLCSPACLGGRSSQGRPLSQTGGCLLVSQAPTWRLRQGADERSLLFPRASHATSSRRPTASREPTHAFPPAPMLTLISLLSPSPPNPLGRSAFPVTFNIVLNTRDLWPLPSGLPTHLSLQLLPLLNSVRLAPPPVIKRRTFQVDIFPVPDLCGFPLGPC